MKLTHLGILLCIFSVIGLNVLWNDMSNRPVLELELSNPTDVEADN